MSPPWAAAPIPTRAATVAAFSGRRPGQWGLDVEGVTSRLEQALGVALTFDACGGGNGGDGYDAALIDVLRARQVPATLFLNRRWIVANPALAAELAADPLFELESHGVRHVPLSVTGSEAYGIAGTASVGEAYDEVVAANDWFAATLGRTPWFFRSGTAHYDEVAVAISRSVGQAVAGFSVNADAGATYTATQVAGELARVRPGDIVISHMNRPGRGTSGGYAAALPTLLDRGVRFVRLRDGF
jgi:peptidoglycan/xylan/chitin deacetylase (PgdA/CDA1 family)